MPYRAGRENRQLFSSRRRTRPAPSLGSIHQPGTHWVSFDVTVHGQEMMVFLDRERAKPALPDMAATARGKVAFWGENAVQNGIPCAR
jgi:hypothetical protein